MTALYRPGFRLLCIDPGFRLLCIDPGVRGCGVAEFEGGELRHAFYVENPVTQGRDYRSHATLATKVYETVFNPAELDRVIIEYPRIYPQSGQQKGDLNDVLDVAACGAAVATFWAGAVESVFPRDWKGQVPKDVMLDRIKKALAQHGWLDRVQKTNKSDTEDILDAAGIGLWRLGLINRKVIHND